jgi:hypothetical protein
MTRQVPKLYVVGSIPIARSSRAPLPDRTGTGPLAPERQCLAARSATGR